MTIHSRVVSIEGLYIQNGIKRPPQLCQHFKISFSYLLCIIYFSYWCNCWLNEKKKSSELTIWFLENAFKDINTIILNESRGVATAQQIPWTQGKRAREEKGHNTAEVSEGLKSLSVGAPKIITMPLNGSMECECQDVCVCLDRRHFIHGWRN